MGTAAHIVMLRMLKVGLPIKIKPIKNALTDMPRSVV